MDQKEQKQDGELPMWWEASEKDSRVGVDTRGSRFQADHAILLLFMGFRVEVEVAQALSSVMYRSRQ